MRESIKLGIDGMHCQRCVDSVCAVLRPLPGVLAVDVKLDPGVAQIEFDATLCSEAALRLAIENAGFDVR